MLNVLPVTIVYFETPFAPPVPLLSCPIPFNVTAAAVGSGQKNGSSIYLSRRCKSFVFLAKHGFPLVSWSHGIKLERLREE